MNLFQQGLIITGTFSSIIDRLQIIVDTAQKFNKIIAKLSMCSFDFVWYSMAAAAESNNRRIMLENQE